MVMVNVKKAAKEEAFFNKETNIMETIYEESFEENINESVNKESVNKKTDNKKSIYKESFNKETFGETSENTMNVARYLDSLEFSSDSQYLDSGETSPLEEFDTQLEVYSESEGFCFPFPFNWSLLFQPKRLNPSLEHLIYWRDAMKSGIIFTGLLFILLGIQRFSIIFVVPFLLLYIMLASVVGRMLHFISRFTKRNQRPRWREYENLVLRLPRAKVLMVTCVTVERINVLLDHLKNLFLFKNTFDSIHICLFLISLCMLGKMMNGMTMVTWIFIFVFTIPKLYELNKLHIDTKLNCIRKYVIIMGNKFRVITRQ